MSAGVFFVLFLCINAVLMQGTGSGNDGNLRLCIVEGRGSYKRGPKYCPILDNEKAGVECVLGTDRVDCLRRISKGSVDFGVFSPEDLVAAQWAQVDVLVTNELKFTTKKFARDIVAVVNKRILPDNSASLEGILRNSTLCHPGVGLEDIRPLSDTISGYLESLVLKKSCDPALTFTENNLKSLADFYGKACKAGPWVPDKEEDARLKLQYPSLCAACGSPRLCSQSDRYWGDMGALGCLADGAGDVSWGELRDVVQYFELNRNTTSTLSENFAYLCRDGTWRGMKDEPCVWLSQPWKVIVAKRKAAEAVSKLAHSLTNSSVVVDKHWHGALVALLELNQALPEPLQPAQTPLDFLARAKGFREAYSQAGCDPPRHITLCTTSPSAKNKCEWMSESGAVYGIEPPLQCVMRVSTDDCLAAVKAGDCDVALADSDWLISGIRDYNLDPLLHEITPIVEHTSTVVAYVNTDAKINKMADLRGKRAAFPRYDGTAWHSVKQYIMGKEKITCKQFMEEYFSEICAPGLDGKKCYEMGEAEALKSLVEGKSDVAFVGMKTYNLYRGDEPIPAEIKKIVPICPEDNKYCFISWSNIGHVFAAKNLTQMRQHEIVNVFTKLDQIFGKRPPFHSPMFAMYGPYNHEMDVLFHNNTRNLATDHVLRTHPYDKIPHNFELMIGNMTDFTCSLGGRVWPTFGMLALSLLLLVS